MIAALRLPFFRHSNFTTTRPEILASMVLFDIDIVGKVLCHGFHPPGNSGISSGDLIDCPVFLLLRAKSDSGCHLRFGLMCPISRRLSGSGRGYEPLKFWDAHFP